MRHSEDLRRRVVKFVEEGGSKAEASRRFGVGLWCVFDWIKRGEDLAPGKPGPKSAHKLDWAALKEAVDKQPDMRLVEMAQKFGVSHHAVWYALRKMKMSRKKNVDVRRGG